ncbi:MAG: hypothetical protein U0228_27320 [Myxococcaceae bacterium]
MTPERWTALCKSLERLTGSILEGVIASHRAEVLTWPASVRRLEADSPWLAGIFEGTFDPRLELAGWASVKQVLERDNANLRTQPFELLKAFGRHLDATFDPPDVVLEESNDIRSAYGCGGGSASWVRGNSTQTIVFASDASESPSAGMRSYDSWMTRGLANGAVLTVLADDFLDGRTFTASGPCPAVLELAPAWTAFVRGGELPEVKRVLEATRVPWR